MKWMIVALVINLMSCALFKTTSRLSAVKGKESSKQSYLDRVDVKTLNRETHTYTWLKDTTVFQYQNIQEYAEEAILEKLSSSEKELERSKAVKKESSPLKFFLFAGILFLVFCLFMFVKKLGNFWQKPSIRL